MAKGRVSVLPGGLGVPVVVFDLEWSSPFAYTCNACSRCCYGKAILVGPYEVLRLARNRGLTTTELLAPCGGGGGGPLRARGSASAPCRPTPRPRASTAGTARSATT